MKTADVIFREDLYPRMNKDPLTVQKYAEDLDVLPPVEINQRNELIDGWHRWTAHLKQKAETISVIVTATTSDAHLLELAIERNASHGLQLSQDDKRNMARSIYHVTPDKEREEKKKHLAKILSVSERTIREWLGRIDKDSKEARNKRIFSFWLSCHTQEEIAERVGISQKAVDLVLEETAEVPKLLKPSADHLTDFEVPIYNIWKQQGKTPGSTHAGNSEIRWLDNLLYLYTSPFDIVIDPFAGGGSTIDICKKRLRRYLVSDRAPIVEREDEIRKHDITTGILKPPQWGDVKLVYLDPPYWLQAKGKYGDDPSDLSNMPLDEFNKVLSVLINTYSKKIKGAYIALIIQPTQWKAPDRQFTDHIGDMLRMVKLPVEMRFSVPYESQQYNAQMVDWAKENKKVLVLTREIIVWRCE
jgi:transposase